jgi:hypothetical protein
LRNELPGLEYTETENWATFKTPGGRRVADLDASQQTIRVFLRLALGHHPELRPGPSSSKWLAQYPSVFRIAREADVATAKRLILSSPATASQSAPKSVAEHLVPQELPAQSEYVEGSAKRVWVNA